MILDTSVVVDVLLGSASSSERSSAQNGPGQRWMTWATSPSSSGRACHCARAWDRQARLTAADALFVALAEDLQEPLVTKDAALARAIAGECGVEVVLLRA